METRTICPKCSPTRKNSRERCLTTNEKGVYICHHCGFSGKKGVTNTPPEIKLNGTITDKLVAYFDKRCISKDILDRNKITLNGKWIQFPYLRKEEVVNIKYRSGNKEFKQEAGREKIFYGLNDIENSEEVIIVEGEIDKLSLEMVGFTNCVSVPDGAPPTNAKSYHSKFNFIKTCEKYFENVKKIILAVDNDAPGKILEAELARRFGHERCYRVTWPEGCKDANEVLIKNDFTLISCIENAKPMPIAGVFTVDDIKQDIITAYEDGLSLKGKSTGWFKLDPYYTIAKRQITVVTGVPSHGKSTFLDAMLINIAKDEGYRFAVFSPENFPLHRHASQLAKCYVGKQFGKGYNGHMSRAELDNAIEWIDEHFYFVMPPDDELTISHILDKTKIMIRRYGVDGLIIDPWNELDHSRRTNCTETEYISESLSKIRRFARQYDIHIWLVAHPTKLYRGKDGKYPVPTMYDISGSAHFRNKTDAGICVWRDLDNDSDNVEIHVQKTRFMDIGKPGMITLKYDKFSGRFK